MKRNQKNPADGENSKVNAALFKWGKNIHNDTSSNRKNILINNITSYKGFVNLHF